MCNYLFMPVLFPDACMRENAFQDKLVLAMPICIATISI